MRFGLRYAEASLAWLDDIDAMIAKRKRKRPASSSRR
jgi:hypothetical protein